MPTTTPPFSGRTITKLRKLHKMTQAQLADQLGITRPYLSAIEGGQRPGMELVDALAERFKVPAAVLLIEPSDEEDPLIRHLNAALDIVLAALAHKEEAGDGAEDA